MLVGTYRSSGEVGDILLSSLPSHVLVNADGNPIVDVLRQEIHRNGVAQASVLDRLLDLLLISAVRTWTSGISDAEHSWLTAGRDPAVQQAIRLIHSSPDKPWTASKKRYGVSPQEYRRRLALSVGQGEAPAGL